MRWIWYIILATTLHSLGAEDSEENDLLLPPPPINLDSNLRKALLKALQELENEENQNEAKVIHSDRVVEKAQASSLSIFANSETVSETPITKTPTSTPQPFVSQKSILNVYQSDGEEKPKITVVEKDEEQILTSASNSFALSNQAKLNLVNKSSSQSASFNLIQNDEKVTPKVNIETTTIATTTSTEESEAKVEDVQFFSAPLVAAFTVHQDELGLPKKVEPIYKIATNSLETRTLTEQRLLQNQQEFQQNQQAVQQDLVLKQQELDLQQKQKTVEHELLQKQKALQQDLLLRQEQLQFDLQQKRKALEEDLLRRQHEANFQQKQKALEQEIFRLNENLKEQTALNFRQQQQNLLLQQQQVRLQAKNPLAPIVNPIIGFTPSQPVKEQPQLFNSNAQNVKGSFSISPSINIDSLALAGRLPLNAQLLPVKEPVNFNNQIRIPVAYQPFVFNQQQSLPEQSNRFHRHESGAGNLGLNNFNQKSNSFSFLKSIESPSHSEHILRNNDNVFRQQFLQPPDPINHNRIFRSNVEARPQYLSHLLHDSGALRGKVSEDLNIITKVLSLNHFGDSQLFGSVRDERRVPES